MRNASVTAISVLLAVLVSGCASGPTAMQQASADYGAYVSPQECVTLAEEAVKVGLRDPFSAQFSHSTPCYKGWGESAPLLGMPLEFGWIQNGEVNAKNAFGGYVGYRRYQALIRDGRVIRICVWDDQGLCIPSRR